MPRPIKVYGWTGWWHDPRNATFPHHSQGRFICAGTSKSAIKRALEDTRYRAPALSEIVETGNKREIAEATARPGVTLVTSLDSWRATATYYAVHPPEVAE